MKRLQTKHVFLAGLLSILGTCRQPHPSHVVAVIDPSASTYNAEQSALGVIGQSLSLPNVRNNSLLTILLTGDNATAMEPTCLGTFKFSKAKKMIEVLDKPKGDTELLAQVENVLRGKLDEPTRYSPVYLAVVRGVETLRGYGCGSENYLKNSTQCYLFVITDGEENVEKLIRHALNSKSAVDLSGLAVNNTGIRVTFCGISNTNRNSQSRVALREQKLEQVWRSLFTHPELVFIQPFCMTVQKGNAK